MGGCFSVTNHIHLVQHPIGLSIHSNGAKTPLVVTALLMPIIAPNKTHSDAVLQIHVSDTFSTRMVYGQLPRSYISMNALDLTAKVSESNVFVAAPYLSNDFEVLKLLEVEPNLDEETEGFDGLKCELRTVCHTLHRVNLVELEVYPDFVLTWSMGGDVEMWDSKTWTMSNRVKAMNVWSRGVRKAVTDQHLQYIYIDIF